MKNIKRKILMAAYSHYCSTKYNPMPYVEWLEGIAIDRIQECEHGTISKGECMQCGEFINSP